MDQHLIPPSGHFEGSRHLFPVRVYFEDTDLSGVAYHANYLRWCERARSEILRLLELNQRAAWDAGEGAYAVAEANLKYRRPARLGDALVIETTATELRAASVRLAQTIWRGEEMLADITIRLGFVAPDGRPRRQPPGWAAAFERFAAKDPE